MNKKAILAFNVLMTFIRILLLIIVMIVIISLIRSFFIMEVNTFNVEVELFIQRVLYSEALMFYDNDIDRFYPSMVDLNKFTAEHVEKNLNKSIYFKNNRKVAAKITLLDFEGQPYQKSSDDYMPYEEGMFPIGDDTSYNDNIEPVYLNKEWYNLWIVRAKSAWNIGPGGVKRKQKNIFVLIKEDNQLKKGYLKFDVIIPNS